MNNYTIQEYNATDGEYTENRYIVLDGEGMDAIGEHFTYEEAIIIRDRKNSTVYYENQLGKLVLAVSDEYGISVKFTSAKCGDTNYLRLNDDSASAIVEFLSNHYTLTLK